MLIRIQSILPTLLLAAAAWLSAPFVSANTQKEVDMAAKIAELEKRLADMEERLSDTEQETKEAKVLATNVGGAASGEAGIIRSAALDILSNRAWRNLRWTQEEQWEGIEKGTSIDTVVEQLGYPPRTVKSLKPRVDLVYFYETSLRDSVNGVRGKIAFKDGVVTTVTKPDFSKLSASP
ncbi:MAG: hypothetical protein ACON39_06260 [Coraliomargaritaceae bacterium]